ncbi:glycosyltransferase family 4 protein [Fusobacterium sp. SB021]|uniref:glycosyltransferase family 4 protein n=1 Tax=Fusobacterium sp. SB021 TaxID=2744227 RepID=UPI003CED9E14
MKKIKIIYNNYLDIENEKNYRVGIGGLTTYITNLVSIFNKLGFEVEIFQFAKANVVIHLENVIVKGVYLKKNKIKALVKKASEDSDYRNDILLFATDFMITKNKFLNTIAIQHGVAWDIPSLRPKSYAENIISIFKNILRVLVKNNKYRKCKHIVCVDYNFVNWYRSQIAYIDNKLYVIPNFSEIPEYRKRINKKEIKIIFARRFEEYRGTRIFIKAINNLLNKYDNLKVTLAGDGSDKEWIEKNILFREKVDFIRYEAEESIKIHSEYDIAVVPTRGSEGTSLSLLEAMAAGCAVVSTYVGGLSNIVLDGYNGFLVEPEVEAVEKGIEKLILDKELRKKFSQKGYETVKEAFSKEKWEEKWIKVINEIINK